MLERSAATSAGGLTYLPRSYCTKTGVIMRTTPIPNSGRLKIAPGVGAIKRAVPFSHFCAGLRSVLGRPYDSRA